MIKVYAPLQMDFAANILVKKIKSLGHSCERVDKTEWKSNDTWIVYNSALRIPLPERLISYQTEQNSTHWFTDRYREILNKSLAVWEYSDANLFEYDNKNISIVSAGIEPKPKVKKDIEVLFYGGLNDRRKQALKNINCNVVDNVYGNKMQSLLSRSKTVLNIHYYEPNVFETFRVNEALSHNCNVVSEYSLHGCEDYKQIVKFGTIPELKHLLSTVGEFKHDISHLDNTEQIKEALKRI